MFGLNASLSFESIFAVLPTEIILSVSDFLPSVDLICLSLCSNRLLNILKGPIRRIRPKEGKQEILIRLERDLVEYFACDICKVLHRYDGSESCGLSGLGRQKSCKLPCVQSGDWFSWPFVMNTHLNHNISITRLSFLQGKLAMRRFYFGPSSGISTDSLYFTQVRDYCLPWYKKGPPILCLFSIEATVCPKHLGLYIRTQDILILEKWDDFHFRLYVTRPAFGINDSTFRSTVHTSYWICRHIHMLNFIAPLVELFLVGDEPKTIRSCEGQCDTCNVDFHITVFEFDSRPAVILTRWRSLGLGITMDDPLWKLHAAGFWETEALLNSKENLWPRLCFEANSCQSFTELSLRNQSYLKMKQYRQVMEYISLDDLPRRCKMRFRSVYFDWFMSHKWFISFKEPSRTRKILNRVLSLRRPPFA